MQGDTGWQYGISSPACRADESGCDTSAELVGIGFDSRDGMRWLIAVALLVGLAAPARAQQTGDDHDEPSLKALPRDLLHDVQALASTDTLIWSGAGAVAALAAHPLDGRSAVELERAQNGTLHNLFVPGQVIGETTVQVGLALTTYAFGRATHR